MSRTTPLLTVLEATWDAVRTHHPDLPPAVLRLGQGHDPRHPEKSIRGHWAPCTWQLGDAQLGEVMLAGERLRDGADGVLATLLHEAAHGLAHVRRIPDTSRQGRYHNRRYRDLGGKLLLDVSRSEQYGWSVTELSPAARERYREPLAEIAGTLGVYRRTFASAAGGGAPRRPSRLKLTCGCRRALYIAPGVAARGPVLCGCCQEPFLPG